MYKLFSLILKKIHIKFNITELIDSIKYIWNFIYILIISLFLYFGSYYLIYYDKSNNYWISSIPQIILLIWIYCKYSSLLMKVRKLSFNNGINIKLIYTCFIVLMFTIIILSYLKDDFIEYYKSSLNISVNIFTDYNIRLIDILTIVYDFLLVTKTSMEIVMVKDAIFQMNNWNIQKTITEYWEELIEAGRIYILFEDRKKENPKLWYIRGDACNDLVDSLYEYHIKKSNKYVINFTEEEQEQIINNRKNMNLYDPDDCLDSDEITISLFDFSKQKKGDKAKKNEYFFHVKLIDFSYFDEKFIKKELIKKYRNKFLILPPSVKAVQPEKITMGKIIFKTIYILKSFYNKKRDSQMG